MLQIDLLQFNNLVDNIYTSFKNLNFIKKGAAITTDSLFSYFIGNLSVYFLLIDKDIIIKKFLSIFPKRNFYFILGKIETINKILKIELILILVTTLETMIGLLLLKINNAVFISIFCGLLDLLPYIGTFIVFIPLTIYKIITKKYITVIGLLCLYIFIQITRQMLEAKFMSSNLNIHPLAIILSIYIGIKIFGLLGLFIAPIYIIFVKEIIFSN